MEAIASRILILRGQRVMLDADLATLYDVQTRRLNEQVRRNTERFPGDFVFQVTSAEFANLKSQFATSSWGGRRKLPLAFTEHGAMFVAQVVGKSMDPAIPDGAYCLFAAPVEGARQGKTVLVQLRDATDAESGQCYTVKRYESEKAHAGDSWRHERITLKPVNPDFEPIVLIGADEGQLQVVAEFIEVLGGES